MIKIILALVFSVFFEAIYEFIFDNFFFPMGKGILKIVTRGKYPFDKRGKFFVTLIGALPFIILTIILIFF